MDQDPASREQLGRSRGGFSTKLHMRVDGKGRPLTFLLTPGQSHNQKGFAPLIQVCGFAAASAADRGAGHARSWLMPRTVPVRTAGSYAAEASGTRSRGPFHKTTYRQRNQVERFFARIKQFRRRATRYEKLAEHYLAIVTLTATVIWLRKLA